MATIRQEIMSIAETQGYDGKSGSTIAEAVNALGSVMGGGALNIIVQLDNNGYPTGTCEYTPAELYDIVVNQQRPVAFYTYREDVRGNVTDGLLAASSYGGVQFMGSNGDNPDGPIVWYKVSFSCNGGLAVLNTNKSWTYEN